MADETPQQIRERVLAEELAKGSDPRVAEGRAKAAEMRAQHGLPIDPEQSWRALLEREGGSPAAQAEAAASEPAAAPAEAAAPEPAQAPPAEAEAAAAPDVSEAAAAQPAPAAAPAPAPSPVAPAPAETPAGPVPLAEPAPPREPEYEPEVGEPLELELESLESFAGIKVRDPRLPTGLLVILVLIPLWAIFYLVAFAGSDSIARTTGCTVNPDHTLVCFQEAEGSGEPAGTN